MNVTVIGLGAMGGGMARSLLRSPEVETVLGFDLSPDLVYQFYEDSVSVGKAGIKNPSDSPIELSNFISESTNVAIIVLVNEAQCKSVCFGGENGENLISLMKPNSCVFISSTVTSAFAKQAYAKFSEKGIQFVDCPMSGGPVRALAGELTMMVAAEPETLTYVDPLLKTMGKEIHVIEGGPGMG